LLDAFLSEALGVALCGFIPPQRTPRILQSTAEKIEISDAGETFR